MKKIIIVAPFLSCSGYGEMARFALNSLKEHQDEYDIYINMISWGQTSWLFEEDETYNFIHQLRLKTEKYFAETKQPIFDISLQITIPNEWKRLAAVNVGYTAGIETTVVSPAWFEPCQIMDKIITTSSFSKDIFLSTIFQDKDQRQHRISTPIDVVHFPVDFVEKSNINFNFSTDFNFLTVNQWGPRKNMEFLISNFVEEFRNENVGLVIKTNLASDSSMDKFFLEEKTLLPFINSLGEKKCKIYFIHGRLKKEDMVSLYTNSKIKAFVTATHGEGYGMPIFEAVQNNLPVIATDWSGHLDFLSVEDKKLFAKVDYELKQIEPGHVWQGVMEPWSAWAYPKATSLRSKMREVFKDLGRFKSWAKKLSDYNKQKFNKEKINDEFYRSVNFLWNKNINSSNDLIFSSED